MPHSGTRLDTAESACKINANPSLKSSGVQTRRQNPNKPKLTLDTNYGGVKITVKDTAAAPTSLSSPNIPGAFTNYVTELDKYCNDSGSNYSDAYILGTSANQHNSVTDITLFCSHIPLLVSDTLSIISAPTIPTKLASELAAVIDTSPTSTITSRTPTCSSLRASSHAGRSYPAPTMATRSWTSSQAQSPFNPRDLGPQLPSTAPIELGEVSLEQVTRLLLGLLSQVENLEQKLEEVKETGIETQTNVENISQTVNVVKDGLQSLQLHGPRTPEAKPPVVEATPRPLPKTEPIGLVSGPSFWPKQPKGLPSFAQPAPQRAIPPRVPSPPLSLRLQSPIGASAPPPPAPAVTYPAPVKVDHPDAYTGKIGSEAKQWLTRMLAWTRLNSRMFPMDQEVLSFLLMNMKDSAGAWAHPHLDQLGSHWAIIQTVEGFKMEFLAAFGNPDATRAAKRKITTLTQCCTPL
ncbi:hypothetical protein RhiXN_05420 [Rhizoctonia solani]|uniref:Retrotransposon gag domain-containing protein n=1 Tax=Rhizoctonia solani TaxID=456999 RepID=A0A8H8NRH6_9AGAM|nr:uncharacterized protein RhiXN_05420 [Rhizoctonia solani]QRW17418.1 hypothetical protein RhiXN_05420 [Rhizoctonia solani]